MAHMGNRMRREAMRETHLLQEQMLRMSLSEVNSYFEENLQRTGTNVDQNKNDPQGDGDQSPVSSANAQFYRDMFSTGGDINHLADVGMGPLSDFAKACVSGDVVKVKEELERIAGKEQDKAAAPSSELIALLETRETAMRLSPLLMVVSMGKNLVPVVGPNHAKDRQIMVAELLLQYGARPDARDVCGKTVCHYGMGAMATEMTLEVVNRCIDAHASSHLFGKQVELQNLKTKDKNGLQGICKGFLNGRRVVYLMESRTTISVKPENLKLTQDDIADAPTKLCDIPDRFGTVCLTEVIMHNRIDVAKMLLEQHQAKLDIKDCDGISPISMSSTPLSGAMSQVTDMVKKASIKYSRREQKKEARTCTNCGTSESSSVTLLQCAKCLQVQYCSKECQTKHWKEGGHKKVCKKLIAKQSSSVVLERPTGGMFTSTFSSSRGRVNTTQPQREADGYKKPRHVGVGEKFDVKVQGGGPMMPLMIYDKSRECSLTVNPGQPGFEELRKAVNAEPTWEGRKTFVAASFDADGNCTVYPGVTSLHKW